MGKKNKLQKFAALGTFPNVYENFDMSNPSLIHMEGKEVDMRGKWAEFHFKNSHPIVLELACGKGEYTIGLAERHPSKNFIGVDIKGARIWKGAKKAFEEERNNVAFLRTRIEAIEHFFAPEEISEIWITFPDPFPKDKSENRRLTSPNFLMRYRKILKKNGIVQLKTDAKSLYDYTMEVLEESENNCTLIYNHEDIYTAPLYDPDLEIKTFYEHMHLEEKKKITFIKFSI